MSYIEMNPVYGNFLISFLLTLLCLLAFLVFICLASFLIKSIICFFRDINSNEE